MFFNSIDFALFLPLFFVLYWLANKKLRVQNVLIVIASYIFYGWWDWRFLGLILFSTIVDYSIGYLLSKEENDAKRKILLWVSIIVNLGFLGFFKYYNFFLENFINAFSFFGTKLDESALNIVLPVGISFYTFQTLSYTIDVYKRKLSPTKDVVAFTAFVSFFPQLVAGPIERATNLLPQFYKKREFDYNKAVDGMRQILWGLFKKVVIADNCATLVNVIFDNNEAYSGSTMLLGGILFAFQIYGDFSGYSDIAIGVSRLFGFNLQQNFAFPYFSRDIAEFWRRWHISLSTWFRDYLYIPLGGSRGGIKSKIKNTFIIFLVSGFWHGANWTFIVWGLLNALYFMPMLLMNRNRVNLGVVAEGKLLPSLLDVVKILNTFILTSIAWIFFRAENVAQALNMIKKIFSETLFVYPVFDKDDSAKIIIVLVLFFLLIEWLGRESLHALEHISKNSNMFFRWLFYLLLLFLIFCFEGEKQEFIYFQF
jgi:D-alanyl-lipoteichoic acid acyltransferase DltB (MBOAT superfamily)